MSALTVLSGDSATLALLREIYRAKAERRRRLSKLPIDEKVLIIERLRDLAVALKAARSHASIRPAVPGRRYRGRP